VIVLEAPSFQEQLNRINKRNSKYETDNLDESFINYLKSLDESNKEVFPKEKCAYITNYSNQIEKIVDQTIVFALAAMFKDEPNVLPLESFYKA
jgi:deoxyadenosine/deoxycytidine kinase